MKNGTGQFGKVISMLKVLLVSFLGTAVLLLLLALLLYKVEALKDKMNIGIVLIYLVSNFLGGFVMGKIQKRKRLIWGLLVGICYFLVLSIAAFIMTRGFYTDMGAAGMALLICAAGGCLGGMLS